MNDLQRKRQEEYRAQMIVMAERARRSGDCEKCFKQYDPRAPSCNDGGCIARWNELRAAATKEASQP